MDELADVHEIAYEQAIRAIDHQVDSLEQLRSRMGVLISAAGLTASLMVSVILNSSRVNSLTAWGIGALIVAGLALICITATAVFVWWPTLGVYVLRPSIIIQEWADTPPPATRSQTQRDLALYMDKHYEFNAYELDRRMRWYTAALVAFLLELIALGVAIWDVTK